MFISNTKQNAVKVAGFALLLSNGVAVADTTSEQIERLQEQSHSFQQQAQELQSQIDAIRKQQEQSSETAAAATRSSPPGEVDLSESDAFEKSVENVMLAMRPVEIYGSLRLSLDYGESDVSAAQRNPGAGLNDGNFGLSANTTVIGFRGSHAFQIADVDYSLIYQLEQNFNPGVSEGDTLGNRDTFGGLITPWGTFRAGLMDTAFKDMGISYTKYTTFVSDPHAILGTGPTAQGRLDLRSANSLRWDQEFGDVAVSLQYGLDQDRGSYGSANDTQIVGTQGVLDDNDNDMYSASLSWDIGDLDLGAAYIDYSSLYASSPISAYRFAANYEIGDKAEVGAIYEDIDGNDYDQLSRSAYGSYFTYDVLEQLNAGVQWVHANETSRGDDSADQLSLNVIHPLTDVLFVYGSITKTFNDDNARYRTADYAHGDRINTVPGGDPAAASIGVNASF